MVEVTLKSFAGVMNVKTRPDTTVRAATAAHNNRNVLEIARRAPGVSSRPVALATILIRPLFSPKSANPNMAMTDVIVIHIP